MTLLSPAQYMDLLKQRADEWQAERPRITGFPPLYEWFIRPGDEDLIDMDAIDADLARLDQQPKPARKPRTYRPASYWRHRLVSIERRLEALTGVTRHDTTDRAAHTGIGIRQTPRQRAKYAARIDATAEKVVKLTGQRDHARRMLRKAEEREATDD